MTIDFNAIRDSVRDKKIKEGVKNETSRNNAAMVKQILAKIPKEHIEAMANMGVPIRELLTLDMEEVLTKPEVNEKYSFLIGQIQGKLHEIFVAEKDINI
jgi:hypothetical protein